MAAESAQGENWPVTNGVVQPKMPDLTLRPAHVERAEFIAQQTALIAANLPTSLIRHDTRQSIIKAWIPAAVLADQRFTVGHPSNHRESTALDEAALTEQHITNIRRGLEFLGFDFAGMEEGEIISLVSSPMVTAYFTESEQWSRERRENSNPSTAFGSEERESTPGPNYFLRLGDAALPHFNALVALLEKQGYSVSAPTNANPHGVYIGEGVEKDGTLKGYGLEGQKPLTIKVQQLGVQTLSAQPEEPDLRIPGLNFIHTHGMALAVCEDGKTWGPSYIIPSGTIATNPAEAPGTQYGQTVFEGMIGTAKEIYEAALAAGLSPEDAHHEAMDATAGKDPDFVPVDVDAEGNVSIFQLKEHARRFRESAAGMMIPEVSEEQFMATIIETVRVNKAFIPKQGGRLYIRPYITGIEGKGAAPATKYIFGVSVFPFADYYKAGASMKVEVRKDIHRPDTGADKAAVNYAGLFKAKAELKQRTEGQYSDILCVDSEGFVEEFGASAVFFIQKDPTTQKLKLVVPKTRNEETDPAEQAKRNILDSITRRSTIEMARALGIDVEIRNVHCNEIAQMEGAFCAGSAAGIVRIGTMDLKENAADEGQKKEFAGKDVDALIELLGGNLQQARRGELTDPRLTQFNSYATVV